MRWIVVGLMLILLCALLFAVACGDKSAPNSSAIKDLGDLHRRLAESSVGCDKFEIASNTAYVVERGHCTSNGENTTLYILRDPASIERLINQFTSEFCPVRRLIGTGDIHLAVGPNWIVFPDTPISEKIVAPDVMTATSQTADTTAEQIVAAVGGVKRVIAC